MRDFGRQAFRRRAGRPGRVFSKGRNGDRTLGCISRLSWGFRIVTDSKNGLTLGYRVRFARKRPDHVWHHGIMQSPSEEVQWTVDGGLITPYFEIKTTFNRSAGAEHLREHVYIYGLELRGDGEIAMRFRPEHRHQHAESSLTIRVDESNWIKTGAEYLGGQHLVSTVTTREHTNWSLSPVDTESDEIWLRLIRAGGTITVAHADDGVDYTTIASTYLPGGVPAMAGIASAHPVSESFWDAAQDLDIDVD
jgi:uncharacterized protein